MDSQSYDTSRFLDAGTDCPQCPRCDCDGHDVGDIWYVESQDYSDIIRNYATCSLCKCVKDSNGNYAECNHDDNYPIGGIYSLSCSNSIVFFVYKCHYLLLLFLQFCIYCGIKQINLVRPTQCKFITPNIVIISIKKENISDNIYQ